jgi:hypothetical protein
VQKRSWLEGVGRVRREKASKVAKPRRARAPVLTQKVNRRVRLFKGNKALESRPSVIRPRVEGAGKTAREQVASREVQLFEERKALKGESQERLSLKEGSEVSGGVNRYEGNQTLKADPTGGGNPW